jgi:hypothetical protein
MVVSNVVLLTLLKPKPSEVVFDCFKLKKLAKVTIELTPAPPIARIVKFKLNDHTAFVVDGSV